MSNWDALIQALPEPHILQTEEWGKVKAQFGWRPIQVVWMREKTGYRMVRYEPSLTMEGQVVAAVQVLQRSIPIAGFAARLSVMYAPKGPLLDWEDASLQEQVLKDIHLLAKKEGAIFIKIDPDVRIGTGVPGTPEAYEIPSGNDYIATLRAHGWHFSAEQIQFRNSVLIDLEKPEEQLLAIMKQKTRYNIRLAERKGVTIRAGTVADLDLLYRMYAETSLRDGFVIRDVDYYHCAWKTFLEAGKAQALIAEVAGEPVAALVLFYFAQTAWYLYGMSRPLHREAMPNYLLQWKAIQTAQRLGCKVYNLWGAPDEFNETDPMWGVFRFKEGLGGTVTRTAGAWDLPTRPFYYTLYTRILPRILDWMRRRGKEETRRQVLGA